MKSTKVVTVMASVCVAVATALAPPANAWMQIGNYDLLTNRYTQASWVWMIAGCIPEKSEDCRDIQGIARLKYYYEYQAKAHLSGNQWTLTVDVPDGLRCPGQALPSHDVYTWDTNTLAGEINSTYDVGCFNGPPGSQFWTFLLQRL